MNLDNRRFARLLLIALAIGFVALIAAGAATLWSVVRSEEHARWVTHTNDVLIALSDFQVALDRAEASRRGYLLDDDEQFYRIYRESAARIVPALDRARALTRDNGMQQQRIAAAYPLVRRQLASMDQTVASARAGGRAAATAAFAAGTEVQALRRVRALAAEVVGEERRLLRLREAEQAAGLAVVYLVLTLAGILLVVVTLGSFAVIGRYTRDLAKSQEELRRANEGLETRVTERTADLKRANDEIQRFAYIVSHDLRSPLVNIMGFTSELDGATRSLTGLIDRADENAPDIVTDEARAAAREDLPEAIGFIRSSTQKMDRLINAILQLSREGRRPIRPEPIDMEAMVKGIADTLAHRLDQTGTAIDVKKPLPAITTDRLAVEQIFSNLIENAVKYTKTGRPGRIAVRGRRNGSRAVFEIEDNGRGIDPRDHERIFELFRRSGAQDQQGEGIGLAHVRALAYRLGGTIGCTSELDAGATFSVSLPVAYAGEERS